MISESIISPVQVFPKISIMVYEHSNGCWQNKTCELEDAFEFLHYRKFSFAQCPKKNVYIKGYPFLLKEFHQFWRDLVTKEFSFEPKLKDMVNKYLQNLKQKRFPKSPNVEVQFVGIHVRRGDYEWYVQHHRPRGGFFFSKKYFQNAMKFFR